MLEGTYPLVALARCGPEAPKGYFSGPNFTETSPATLTPLEHVVYNRFVPRNVKTRSLGTHRITTVMVLELVSASEQDVFRITDIHMAAFGSNRNLLVQFPTAEAQKALHTSLVEKSVGDVSDPHTAVLVARDTELDGEIVSFAKWSLPTSNSENETPWRWPVEARHDLLKIWTKVVEETQVNVLRNEACYSKKSCYQLS